MNFLVSLNDLTDWGLLALRLAIAAIFLVHGMQKRAMWNAQPSEQMPAQMLRIIRILSIAEPLGGLAMVLGFLTQFASVGLGIIMLGAINLKVRVMKVPFTAHDKAGWETDLIILAGTLVLLFTGAGAVALDRLLFGL